MSMMRREVRIALIRHAARAGIALVALLLIAAFSPIVRVAPAAPAPTAPKAYIGLFKDNAVAVLDTRTNTVLRTIPVPPGPHGLVLTPDGRKVYVSGDGASTVSVIDTATDRVVTSIEVGATPHGLAISSDGHLLLASVFGANRAVLIDTTRDQIVAQVPVPQPHNSAISPDGRTAYVGSQQQGATALVVLDLVAGTRTGMVPLERAPRALNFSPDGKWLYVTVAGDDAVLVLDPASNRVVARIPVGASPHHPLFTPDGRYGLVVSQGPGELDILDPGSSTVSGTVPVGNAPHWIAVTSDSKTAFVTNEASNTVSVVDLVSRRVTATVPVGDAPRKIAVQAGATAASSSPSWSAILTLTRTSQGTPSLLAAAQSITIGGHTFSDHGTAMVKNQTTLGVEADDYYFAPTFLQGQPGQKLTLEIESQSGTLHNFSVPEQKIDIDIPPKGKARVEVTFPRSGALRFFCKFHTGIGMNGRLLAGDATP